MRKVNNWITELDKFVLNYFREVDPFEIKGKPLKTEFYVGSPANRSISEIITDTGDIAYPVLIISRGPSSNNFDLMKERNIPNTDATLVTLRRFARDKYINSEENNINLELYRYKAPTHFKCQYQLIFWCEFAEHAAEFQSQFLDRLDQNYLRISSEKFKSMFFNLVWMHNGGISQEDNFAEQANNKREIKLTTTIEGEGYFMSLDSERVIRGISTVALAQALK